jgi:uncharacterized protein YxeA
MKKIIYNLLSFLLIIIIITSFLSKNVYQESFVPKIIKENYRPIHRRLRSNYEGFYNKSSQNISNIFKKFGII